MWYYSKKYGSKIDSDLLLYICYITLLQKVNLQLLTDVFPLEGPNKYNCHQMVSSYIMWLLETKSLCCRYTSHCVLILQTRGGLFDTKDAHMIGLTLCLFGEKWSLSMYFFSQNWIHQGYIFCQILVHE